jgi:beta-glucosidase
VIRRKAFLSLLCAGLVAGALGAPPAAAAHPAQRADALLARMTTQDRIDLVTGNFAPLARLGIPALTLVDASSGLRGETGVTAFPVPEALAATFDTGLAERYGSAVGAEGRGKGYNVMLGPTVDLSRTGLSGRQTESYGEDPLLSGDVGAGVARGMGANKVIATVKHHTAYNQEVNRDFADMRVSERALREVHDAPTEAALTRGGADAVMCSYPKINGTYACENKALLDRLRTQAGFRGFVVSDFNAGTDRVAGFNAGVDSTLLWPDFPRDAFTSGAISPARLAEAARRILVAMFDSGVFDNPVPSPAADVSTVANKALADQVGRDGSVLLKNSGPVLPIARTAGKKVAVIGPAGRDAITGVAGSSYVEPGTYLTPVEAIRSAAGSGVTVTAAQGSLGDARLPVVPSTALRAPNGSAGLLGTYYNGPDFAGPPIASSVSPTIDWTGAPVGGLPGAWSARWTGTITPTATGLVRFSAVLSGAVTVKVGGTTVISGGRSFSNFLFGPYSYPLQGQLRLTAGAPVPITVEYSTRSPQGAAYFGPELHLGWQPQSLIPAAVTAARAADVAVVYVNQASGEGMDRDSFDLPGDQNELVDAVATANPNTVVVLNTPGAVLMPWLGKVRGVLQAWYPGRAVGTGPAAVLFGDADPGGRLPVTFPASNAQRPVGPSAAAYPGVNGRVSYDEDVFLGYPNYLRNGWTPLFPFGYGLSYTTFARDAAVVTPLTGDAAGVRVTVRNTGARTGTEVVQAYVGSLPAAVPTPARRLAGYAKVTLRPGESRTVQISIPRRVLSYWDTAGQRWVTPRGAVQVYVGKSAADTRGVGAVTT